MAYFDAAANVPMSPEILETYIKWANIGNPSGEHPMAKQFQAKLESFKKYIRGWIRGIDDDWEVIFTSGASEANSMVIHMLGEADYPHVVAAPTEHKGIIEQLKYMSGARDVDGVGNLHIGKSMIRLTWLPVDCHARVKIDLLDKVMEDKPLLVCVQSCNNETGAYNDIESISLKVRAASSESIIHCDAVQSFGKVGFQNGNLVDSIAVSFHKLGGPVGVGALIIRKSVLTRYAKPIVWGMQNNHLRGGTYSAGLIMAAFAACIENFKDRPAKNKLLADMSSYLAARMFYKAKERGMKVCGWTGALQIDDNPYLLLLTDNNSAPGHMMWAFVDAEKRFCNVKMRKALASKNIIISTGSACNTDSKLASHVMSAIGADEYIKAGVFRVSMLSDVGRRSCEELLRALWAEYDKQMSQ